MIRPRADYPLTTAGDPGTGGRGFRARVQSPRPPLSFAGSSISGTVWPSCLTSSRNPIVKACARGESGASSGTMDLSKTGTGRATTSGQFAGSRGTSRANTRLRSGALASRALKGEPRFHRADHRRIAVGIGDDSLLWEPWRDRNRWDGDA
jgi:hypothetical protein